MSVLSEQEMRVLHEELKRDEGVRLMPYKDSVGLLTIGCGRNIEERGISEDEMEHMLTNDIAIAVGDCMRIFHGFEAHPPSVKRVLINMAFNLGGPTLRKFRNMIAAVDAGDYGLAAEEALDSRWARQVGARAVRIAEALRGAA